MRKTLKQPFVSVVMPVYNAGDFLVESIRSILEQSHKNLELIVVDDKSTDDSWKIIREFKKKDSRIRIFRNKRKKGVSETVKKAIAKTKSKYIARMDADDISLPTRIEKQVDYLIRNRKTVALGGQCLIIDREGKLMGEKKFPTDSKKIHDYIFKFVPVQQPTIMIAKHRLPKNFMFYRDGMNTAEEIELLFKLFQYGKVENMPDYLLCYRLHGKNTSLADLRKTFLLTFLSRIKALFVYNYKPTMSGVLVSLIQLPLVLLLPQKVTLVLYELVRKIILSKPKINLNLKVLKNVV